MNIRIYISNTVSNTNSDAISSENLFIANDYDEMRTVLLEEMNKVPNTEFSYSWPNYEFADWCYKNADCFEDDAEKMVSRVIDFMENLKEGKSCVFFCEYETFEHKRISIYIDEVDTDVK